MIGSNPNPECYREVYPVQVLRFWRSTHLPIKSISRYRYLYVQLCKSINEPWVITLSCYESASNSKCRIHSIACSNRVRSLPHREVELIKISRHFKSYYSMQSFSHSLLKISEWLLMHSCCTVFQLLYLHQNNHDQHWHFLLSVKVDI